MSEAWRRRFKDLSADAVQILRAMSLLGVTDVAADELAATVPLGLPETTTALDALRHAGWVRTTDSGAERLDADAVQWLTKAAAMTATTSQAAALAGRLAMYHISRLDVGPRGDDQSGRWAVEHRAGVIEAIRAASTAGLHDVATRLATAAWRVADRVPDPSWWRELAQHGEYAANRASDPAMLITLLRLSAAVFADAEDEMTAEQHWVRALKLADERGDQASSVAVLTALGGLYRRWERLDKALDTWVELVDEYQESDDTVALAGALAEVGATMLAADRPADAPTYLSRADALLTESSPAAVSAVLHAWVLELWGRSLWATERYGAARRRFHRALAMLVDVDDAAADRIRGLLATETGAQLPAGTVVSQPDG